MVLFEMLQPEIDRVWRNGERGRIDLAGASNPAARARPRKKRQNRSWRATVIAEIEVICPRVIEVDGALNEAQTEHQDIKIQVSLRIACDRCYVVEPANFALHVRAFHARARLFVTNVFVVEPGSRRAQEISFAFSRSLSHI